MNYRKILLVLIFVLIFQTIAVSAQYCTFRGWDWGADCFVVLFTTGMDHVSWLLREKHSQFRLRCQ